ncbi:unnamed protein product [Phytophthora fragariaefolia]|uniref:Unnamed protein product n=1 Tax=Phytophthora fragariaefolia TaxID=1490495 RepID=A0A9W6XSX4_9STRA|nr:unnamed protein product [Phytophthora fragariaefolia]
MLNSPADRAPEHHPESDLANRTCPDISSSGYQPGFAPKWISQAPPHSRHRLGSKMTQRYQNVIHVLGMDLSRAFDTIDREKLLDFLLRFLEDDDIRLIKLLLVDTTLSLRTGSTTLPPFCSNIGTHQGESPSPVLFVVYQDAAFRDLADHFAVPETYSSR